MMKKSFRRILCFALLLLLVFSLSVTALGSSIFGERQLFDFLPTDIKSIRITSGNSGMTVTLDDAEAIEEAVRCLTDFRYEQTVVHSQEVVSYEYSLVIEYADSFLDGKKEFYYFDHWSIRLDDKSYFGKEGSFDALTEKLWDAPEALFDDVKPNDKYYGAIKYALEKELFAGASESKFMPDGELTRAMAVTVLHRLARKPESEKAGFEDILEGAYYQAAVNWAVEKGIIKGTTEKTFSPNLKVTREQFAVMLYRYVQSLQYSYANAMGDVEAWFSDHRSISPYAHKAAEWSLRAGIMGYKDKEAHTMEPRGTVTRAEAADALKNLSEYIESGAAANEDFLPLELIKGAEEVAQEWVDDLLDNEGDLEVSECFHENIKIYQISEDQNTICFSLRIVFKPKDYNEPFWWAGNTQEGTGELAGYLIWDRQIKATREADGWTKVSAGTAGIGL